MRLQRCREDASSHNCHKCANDGHRDRNTCLLKNILYATECWGSLDERVASAPCGDNCSLYASSPPPRNFQILEKFLRDFPSSQTDSNPTSTPQVASITTSSRFGLSIRPKPLLGRKLAQVLGHVCASNRKSDGAGMGMRMLSCCCLLGTKKGLSVSGKTFELHIIQKTPRLDEE